MKIVQQYMTMLKVSSIFILSCQRNKIICIFISSKFSLQRNRHVHLPNFHIVADSCFSKQQYLYFLVTSQVNTKYCCDQCNVITLGTSPLKINLPKVKSVITHGFHVESIIFLLVKLKISLPHITSLHFRNVKF